MKPMMQAAAVLALALGGAAPLAGQSAQSGQSGQCDAACLEQIARDYRSAYRAHDRTLAPFAQSVRYTENNVEMPFPDGTWDTVTAEPGPPLVLSDPVTGQVAIFTSVMQDEIAGFLAIRLHVNGERQIDEVEHILSTRRTLSSQPTPIGNIQEYVHAPVINEPTPDGERASRDELAAHANGYFDTLQMNDGEIRGTCFHDSTTRRENGLLFSQVKADFERGRYRFNNRVRRDVFMIDEARQVAVGRGFIDHKGVLNEYLLTDGTEARSIFQEPQSWGLLEAFKVNDGCIAAVVATFYQAPYYQMSPWTQEPGR